MGNNSYTTEVLNKAPKIVSMDLNQNLYAEQKENKLIIVVWEKGSLSDSIVGVGKVALDSLVSGEKKIVL